MPAWVSVTGSQLCCSRRVCGGEIRTARLLQGLALPAQRQTQVRQTSFDVSTEKSPLLLDTESRLSGVRPDSMRLRYGDGGKRRGYNKTIEE